MMAGTVGPISCWWQRYDTWTEHMFQLGADVEKVFLLGKGGRTPKMK